MLNRHATGLLGLTGIPIECQSMTLTSALIQCRTPKKGSGRQSSHSSHSLVVITITWPFELIGPVRCRTNTSGQY